MPTTMTTPVNPSESILLFYPTCLSILLAHLSYVLIDYVGNEAISTVQFMAASYILKVIGLFFKFSPPLTQYPSI